MTNNQNSWCRQWLEATSDNTSKSKVNNTITVNFNQVGIFVADDNINFSLVTSFADNPTVTWRLHYQFSIIHLTHSASHITLSLSFVQLETKVLHSLWVHGTWRKCRISVFQKPNHTEPSSKFKNWKVSFHSSVFEIDKNRLRQFGDSFSRCLIHKSSSNMTIGSTVKVFFFLPYLCTSSSESLQAQQTISWTNSVNSKLESNQQSEYTVNNTQCKKINRKITNSAKPKLNRKPQFTKLKPKSEPKSFFANCTPLIHLALQKYWQWAKLVDTQYVTSCNWLTNAV